MSDYTYILHGREYCKACGDDLPERAIRVFAHECEKSDLYARSMERYRALENLYKAIKRDAEECPNDSDVPSAMEEARILLGKEQE